MLNCEGEPRLKRATHSSCLESPPSPSPDDLTSAAVGPRQGRAARPQGQGGRQAGRQAGNECFYPGQRERSPDYQKLYSRGIRIWDTRRGQPDRSAMEGPHPGGTAFMITVDL